MTAPAVQFGYAGAWEEGFLPGSSRFFNLSVSYLAGAFRRGVGKAVQSLSFQKAAKRIRDVDSKLEGLLKGVWFKCNEDRREKLSFTLAKYPFRSFLVKNGKALDPKGLALRSDLLIAGAMPIGIILSNTAEVIDEIIRKEGILRDAPIDINPKGNDRRLRVHRP